jgi:ABC-type uncharacterized transport system substrate-binding protein
MFIDINAKFMISDSLLEGFYVYWDFDEMNSAMILEEFDTNGDGRFNKSERASIEQSGLATASRQNYYTAFTWENNFLKIRKIEKFNASVVNGATVQFSFFVRCDLALEAIANKKFSVFFEDPSMFIAFALNKKKIQTSMSDSWSGNITFEKIDYIECIIVTIDKRLN